MRDDVVKAIKEYSDQYAQKLWQRFLNQNSLDQKEAEIFRMLHSRMKIMENAAFPDDLSFSLFSEDFRTLPLSFFSPGSTSEIFINTHSSFMDKRPHAHEYFEIVYVEKGQVTNWIDGKEIKLSQGDLCIHNPNALNMILDSKDDEDVIINIILPPNIFQRSFFDMLRQNRQLDEFFNRFSLSSDRADTYMAFLHPSNRTDTIIELLVEEFLRGEDASRIILESTLVVLFGELIRNYHPDPFLTKLTTAINEDLESVSIKEIADRFGYQKNYFSNLVKEKTGYTFNQLVTETRIQKAVNLLLFSNDSIEKISEAIGYRSTASFFTHFRQKYQITPAEFRRLNSKNQ